MARILAKALNCENGPTPNPCGTCQNCERVTAGQSVNVIEIDAASNRGIDEIRELRERVRYAPVEGRYKVYIIDEVHMLTPEAFNALLKTLEEPPEHTIFVLATTELQKVPLTILSRCQRLDFGRIKMKEVEGHLRKVGEGEGVEIDDKALNLIARSSDGCMRDAISLLDQLVSFAGNKIKYDDVILLLGTANEDLLLTFADSLSTNNIPKVLELIECSLGEGRSSLQVTRDLIGHFRCLLHIKVGSTDALELTADYLERLKNQASQFELSKIKEIIKALSRAELDMKWHPHGRLVLEVALLELLDERGVVGGGLPTSREAKQETRNEVRNAPEVCPIPDLSPVATAQVINDSLIAKIKSNWPQILDAVKKKSIFGYVSLHEGEPTKINEKGKLEVAFKRGYSFHKERLEELANKKVVEQALEEVLAEKLLIDCVIFDEASKPAGLSAHSVAEFFGGKVLTP